MKNIILILISFLFILGSCSTPNFIEQDLYDDGYRLNEDTNTMYRSWNNSSIFVELDENGITSTIGMNHDITNYQSINLYYIISDEAWSASYTNGEEIVVIDPKDAYAYIELLEQEAAQELLNLAESNNISTRALENGDSSIVDKLISPDFIISNIKITDSPYTNPKDGDNFLYAMHYIQVNFDLTNNISEVINLGETKLNVCYTIEKSYECTNLENIEPSDTNLTTKVLDTNEMINIQLKAHIPVDATDYDIGIVLDTPSE